MQPAVGLALAALAMREFVSRESFCITRRARQRGGLLEKFRCMFVIVVLVAIKAGQRLVELRTIRIALDSAFEEIFPELEIFALGL